ncbi:mannosyltransferase [Kineococcus xinjiangensis]|uniref:Mannosyltransferase n=1 Tax=Kineococcus xinjiangensis TaxID=512762 RepID=A0A2S6IU41_9ACTN|nr:glycosyltransferase family 39 protein [Kineococcus xinjiangensis]PPK97763.1 mannosyltransferase [Kineococcus xinjiangensis]
MLLGCLAAAAGLVVFGWGAGMPSAWRDEAVTLAVASRSVGDILALARSVDLVHTPYYLLVHALFGSDPSLTAARWVSVVAAALTGPVLYGTARRAADRAVGCTAVALWLALPLVSRYAQEARPYALAALLAALSSYLLLRACARPGARRGWVLYALSLPVVLAVNTLAGLVLLGHAAWLLTAPGAAGGPSAAARPGRVVLLRRGGAAAAAGLLLAAPLVLAAQRQAGQVAFLQPPALRDLTGHVVATAGSRPGALLLVGAAALVLAAGRHRRLALLGAAWGALPVPLLWALAQVHPLWTTRYLVPTLPGLCLLLAGVAALGAGSLLARRGPAPGARARGGWRLLPAVALVAALAATGLPRQLALRGPVGHAEDVRGVAALVAERARPGDAVLFVPNGEYRYRVVVQSHPEAFAGLADVALARGPEESATLVGVEHGPEGISRAMADVERVWVIGRPGAMIAAEPGDRRKLELLARRYRQVDRVDLADWTVREFVRR